MAHEQPKVPGEGSAEFINAFLGYLFSLIKMFMFILFPVAIIGIDLYLSGAFMDGYSNQYGAHGVITEALPFIFTFATTGLQVAINARTKNGFAGSSTFGKCAIVVGWGLIALDTATDVGGFTALYTDDVNVGANIVPPGFLGHPFADPFFFAGVLLTVLFCGGQEKILPLLFGRWADTLRGGDDMAGASLVRLGEAAGGYIYTWIGNILKPVGLASILLLDVVLAPSFLGEMTGTPAAWVISIVTTGFGWFLWEHAQKVAFHRLPDGTLGLNALNLSAKLTLGVAWLIAVLDVLLDVAGYTMLVYGDRSDSFLLPPVVSWNWAITALIVGVACFAGDVLIMEVLRRPGTGGGTASPSPSPSPSPDAGPQSFWEDDDERFEI